MKNYEKSNFSTLNLYCEVSQINNFKRQSCSCIYIYIDDKREKMFENNVYLCILQRFQYTPSLTQITGFVPKRCISEIAELIYMFDIPLERVLHGHNVLSNVKKA